MHLRDHMNKVIISTCLTILIICSGSYAGATTIYVDGTASGSGTGETWTDACTDLQVALTQAIADDEIWVAAGTYYPSQEVGGSGDRFRAFQLMNDLAIYGGFAGGEGSADERDIEANPCVLSGDIGVEGDIADNCLHVFHHPEDFGLTNTAILDGFTITGGNADLPGGDSRRGGGMFNEDSSPLIRNCTFTANQAYGSTYARGGGMCNYYCAPVLIGCKFTSNISYAAGAGIYNASSSPTIIDCLFDSNNCGEGGVGDGGAIYNSGISAPLVRGCSFINNYAKYNGGAIVNTGTGANGYFANCIFSDNTAGMYGGASFNYNGTYPTFVNCLFNRNEVTASNGHGGVLYNSSSSPSLINCILHDNTSGCVGQGIYSIQFSDPIITNCILDDIWAIYDASNSEAIVTYCALEQAGYEDPLLHNIYADPLFADPDYGDFHLLDESPCIDAGNNDALPADLSDLDDDGDTAEQVPLDFEGHPRRLDDEETDDTGYGDAPIVDMGIDEFGSIGSSVDEDCPWITSAEIISTYPNPSSTTTTIRFELPAPGDVTLAIYTLDGRLVRTLLHDRHSTTINEIQWNGADQYGNPVPSGVYFCRLELDNQYFIKRMVVQK